MRDGCFLLDPVFSPVDSALRFAGQKAALLRSVFADSDSELASSESDSVFQLSLSSDAVFFKWTAVLDPF